MHQTTYGIPGDEYEIRVIQTLQPPIPPETDGHSLILDLDVYTIKAMSADDALLKKHLDNMRWVKDKAFFTLLKPRAIKEFRRK